MPAAVLVAAVFALYAVTAGFEFLRFDDPDYTFANSFVKNGLTWSGVKEAFTNARHGAIWMPITWLSYMIDIAFFGPGAGAHHVVNVLLHAGNAVLLWVLCRRLVAGDDVRAIAYKRWHRTANPCMPREPRAILLFFFVLFWALHPQRVEAVAWIASRKELLWAFFTLCGLLAWNKGKWGATCLWCACACMSKPTALVFPFLALLVGVGGLGGLGCIGGSAGLGKGDILRALGALKTFAALGGLKSFRFWGALGVLLVMAALTGGLAVYSQTHPAGMVAKDLFYAGLGERLLNAVVAVGLSLGQMVIPVGLHLDYRAVPGGWPVDGALGLMIFMAAVAVLFFAARGETQDATSGETPDGTRGETQDATSEPRTANHESTSSTQAAENRRITTSQPIFWGLAWFLIAFAPTLGIFGSFGEHARADRFLYVPAMVVPLVAARVAGTWGEFRWFSAFRWFSGFKGLKGFKGLLPLGAIITKSPSGSGRAALCRGRGRHGGRPSQVFAIISIVYLAFLVVQAVPLIWSYRSDEAAFARTLACDPLHGRALAHVGEARCAAAYNSAQSGDDNPAQSGAARAMALDEGIAMLRKSQELRPRDVTAGKLAYALMKRGRAADWDEIRAVCAPFAAAPARNAQGRILAQGPKGQDLAVLERDRKGQALEALGTAELRGREWKAAAAHLSRSILAPGRFYSAEDAQLKLAFALHNGGQRTAARRIFSELTQSTRADISARAEQACAALRRSPTALLFW